jgi:predicted HAD superfamily phosphohydrolase YqeG
LLRQEQVAHAHLDILQKMQQKNFPMDETVVAWAVLDGHFHIVDWAHHYQLIKTGWVNSNIQLYRSRQRLKK